MKRSKIVIPFKYHYNKQYKMTFKKDGKNNSIDGEAKGLHTKRKVYAQVIVILHLCTNLQIIQALIYLLKTKCIFQLNN